MMLPSKELLIKAMGYKNPHPLEIEDSKLYLYKEAGENITTINIYELAYKCKEWALSEGHILKHWTTKPMGGTECYCESNNIDKYPFEAETEQESIFKACEWILKETK